MQISHKKSEGTGIFLSVCPLEPFGHFSDEHNVTKLESRGLFSSLGTMLQHKHCVLMNSSYMTPAEGANADIIACLKPHDVV